MPPGQKNQTRKIHPKKNDRRAPGTKQVSADLLVPAHGQWTGSSTPSTPAKGSLLLWDPANCIWKVLTAYPWMAKYEEERALAECFHYLCLPESPGWGGPRGLGRSTLGKLQVSTIPFVVSVIVMKSPLP